MIFYMAILFIEKAAVLTFSYKNEEQILSSFYKTFIERQQSRPAEIRKWNISWLWSAYCDPLHGRNVISSISSSWPKPIMENVRVLWNAQKLTEHGHFDK